MYIRMHIRKRRISERYRLQIYRLFVHNWQPNKHIDKMRHICIVESGTTQYIIYTRYTRYLHIYRTIIKYNTYIYIYKCRYLQVRVCTYLCPLKSHSVPTRFIANTNNSTDGSGRIPSPSGHFPATMYLIQFYRCTEQKEIENTTI